MIRHIVPLATILLATSGAAQSGDVLPLKHGSYVAEGTPCADAPFAALQTYDGKGIGDAHSSDCRARIVSHQSSTYVLNNDCRDAGAGSASRSGQQLKLRVDGRDRYAVISGKQASAFRWCAATN